MKISVFLLFFSIFQITASSGFSQVKMDFALKNVTLDRVLEEINSQTGYKFFFKEQVIDLERKMSITANKEYIHTVLSKLFMGTTVKFDILKKQIVLTTIITKPKEISVEIQKNTVKGVVTDKGGNFLPGVNIIVVGTTKGTQSDFDGNYSIEANKGDVLEFSYVGMKTTRIIVSDANVNNVKLEEDAASLEEIVVIGYGTQKKTNLTGSVSAIKSEDIVKNSTSNISSALSGRLAGLVTVQSSGEPGKNQSSLRIRGVSSINGSGSPLVLVDGIARSLNAVNSNDIESITVLKDAAAASIYGMRAANGVILLTTKRGGSKTPVVSYNSYYGVEKATRMPDFLNSFDYGTLLNEANINDGTPAAYTPDELQKFKNGSDPDRYPNTDWIGETLGTGTIQSHDLSLRGGYEKVKYFTSLGYLTQDGIYATSGYKKYNFRTNIDVEVNNNIDVQADFSGYYEDYKSPASSTGTIFSGLMRTPPTEVNKYSNGEYSDKSLHQEIYDSGYGIRKDFTFQSKLVLNIKVPFIEGLSLTTQVAYDRFAGRRKNFTTPFTYTLFDAATGDFSSSTPSDRGETASLSESSDQRSLLTVEQIVDYKKTIGLHEFGAKFIYSKTESRRDYLDAKRSNFVGTTVDFFTAGDAETRENNNFAVETGIVGYAGRLNYAYDEKYFVEFNGRYDGSYRFDKSSRYGFFPSLSAAWRISQEDFLSGSDIIDNLKLRLSYGKLGNDGERDNLPAFRHFSVYTFNESFIDDGSVTKTLSSSGIADKSTTWEKAETYNVGIDLSLWNGLLSVEADMFYKRTSDILTTQSLQVPGSFGGNLPLKNIGTVDNKGFEVVLGHNNTVGEVSYHANFNFGFARNKVIDIAEAADVDDRIKRTGRSVGASSRIGWEAAGLFMNQSEIDALNANAVTQTGDAGAVYQAQNPKPGDIKYSDLNGDGVVNSEDRTIIGFGNVPEINYGLNLGAEYKNFDFSILFQGAANFDMYLSNEAAWAFFNGGKVFGDHLGRAQIGTDGNVINQDATYPRLSISSNSVNERTSSYWIKSGDYVRLKNIELGYTLPKSLMNKMGVSHFRIYVNGRNLYTWSDIKHLDPENPQSRGWFYPQQKVFNLGVNVQL